MQLFEQVMSEQPVIKHSGMLVAGPSLAPPAAPTNLLDLAANLS